MIEAKVKNTQNWFVSFLEYLLFVFIIIEFNTAYLEYEQLEKYLFYGTFFLTLLLFLFRKGSFVMDRIISIYFFGSVLPFFNVYPGAERYFMKLFWIILPMFMLYLLSLKRIGFDQITSFLLKYSNIVIVLALISLVYWTLGSNMEIIQPTTVVPNSWGRVGGDIRFIPTYDFVYFETQDTSFMGYQTVRNSGIFNEGPMYNMILCVALAMELFLRSHKSIFRIIVLAITIATTFTTTGFLFLALVSAWIVFKFFSQKSRIVLLAVLPVLVIGMMNFSDAILEEKEESSSGEGSVRARTIDILTCIDIGMENPILGQGLFTKKARENEGGSYGFSNSLFTLFADGGLYTVFLYVAALVLIPLRYLRARQQLWPLMMFSFFLVFSITVSFVKLLTLLFVAFGCSMINDERLDNNDENKIQESHSEIQYGAVSP
jgi:hypothetical protein